MVDAIQVIARQRVRDALRGGKLSRPAACQACGAAERKGCDGRSLLHAHHENHMKPLDVQWLCAKCHRKVTRIPRGANNGFAVLSAGLVRAARVLRAEGFAIKDIADFYGCSRAGLSHAVTGRTWSPLAEREKGAK